MITFRQELQSKNLIRDDRLEITFHSVDVAAFIRCHVDSIIRFFGNFCKLISIKAMARHRCHSSKHTLATTIEPTTYCPPRTCHNLYRWNQDACDCVCPLQLYSPAHQFCADHPGECFVVGDCECGCITTRPPCIETTCPNGGYRNEFTCECEGGTETTLETTETETITEGITP